MLRHIRIRYHIHMENTNRTIQHLYAKYMHNGKNIVCSVQYIDKWSSLRNIILGYKLSKALDKSE